MPIYIGMEKELYKALTKLIHVHGLCGKCVLASLYSWLWFNQHWLRRKVCHLWLTRLVKSMSCVYGRTFLLASLLYVSSRELTTAKQHWLCDTMSLLATYCIRVCTSFSLLILCMSQQWKKHQNSELSSRDWSVEGLFSDLRVIFNAYIVALLTDLRNKTQNYKSLTGVWPKHWGLFALDKMRKRSSC